VRTPPTSFISKNEGMTEIRRGNFASKQMLKIRIEQFINYFNATMARPFRWTYAGKPLAE
jgi:hypothetical protein